MTAICRRKRGHAGEPEMKRGQSNISRDIAYARPKGSRSLLTPAGGGYDSRYDAGSYGSKLDSGKPTPSSTSAVTCAFQDGAPPSPMVVRGKLAEDSPAPSDAARADGVDADGDKVVPTSWEAY